MTPLQIRTEVEGLLRATRPEQRTSYERALLALAELVAQTTSELPRAAMRVVTAHQASLIDGLRAVVPPASELPDPQVELANEIARLRRLYSELLEDYRAESDGRSDAVAKLADITADRDRLLTRHGELDEDNAALTKERQGYLAELLRIRPVFEAAKKWRTLDNHDAYPTAASKGLRQTLIAAIDAALDNGDTP